jgi:hypothetical protein
MPDLGRIFIPVISAEYDQFHLFCHAGVTLKKKKSVKFWK